MAMRPHPTAEGREDRAGVVTLGACTTSSERSATESSVRAGKALQDTSQRASPRAKRCASPESQAQRAAAERGRAVRAAAQLVEVGRRGRPQGSGVGRERPPGRQPPQLGIMSVRRRRRRSLKGLDRRMQGLDARHHTLAGHRRRPNVSRHKSGPIHPRKTVRPKSAA